MSKIKNGGLDQYGLEQFGRLILLQSEKCGTERVKWRRVGGLYFVVDRHTPKSSRSLKLSSRSTFILIFVSIPVRDGSYFN